MGASYFEDRATGTNAQEAFDRAKEQAFYDYGHAGYSGSIAEKDSFKVFELPVDQELDSYIQELRDDQVADKWGDAGCIDLGDSTYIFFGYASS